MTLMASCRSECGTRIWANHVESNDSTSRTPRNAVRPGSAPTVPTCERASERGVAGRIASVRFQPPWPPAKQAFDGDSACASASASSSASAGGSGSESRARPRDPESYLSYLDPESAGRRSGMNTAQSIIATAWNGMDPGRVTRLGSFSDGSGHRSEGPECKSRPERGERGGRAESKDSSDSSAGRGVIHSRASSRTRCRCQRHGCGAAARSTSRSQVAVRYQYASSNGSSRKPVSSAVRSRRR
jgi:hypothetical protein